MKNAKSSTATGAVTFSRLVLSLLVALVLGAMLDPGVEATKKGPNTVKTVKERIGIQRDLCETLGGGTLTVTDSPFVPNKISMCEGGDSDGRRCTHTPKKTICSQTLTAHEDVAAPPAEGAVLEDPTAGATSVAAPTSGQVAAQSENDGQQDEDERGGKRKHRGHNGKPHNS